MKPIGCFLAAALASLLLTGGPASAERAEPLTGAFDPEQVLVNLEQIVEERNWQRYGDFLAREFRFIPYDSVPIEYPLVKWEEWGRKREVRFVEELVSPDHGARLDLLDNVLDLGQESQGRAEWDLVYTLVSRDQVFRSRAIFIFEKVDNLWYLLRWIDTTIETEKESGAAIPTSGSLRGALSQ